MKVVFISGLYAIGSEKRLLHECRRAALQIASNTFQWSLVEGLIENNVDLRVVSFPYLPCFPCGYKALITPKQTIEHNGKAIGTMDSYCTIPIIKNWHIKQMVSKAIERIAKDTNKNEPIYIITYTASSSFVAPVVALKKKYDSLRICPIITDLIELYNDPIYKRSFVKKLQGEIEIKQTTRNYPFIDKFILLSDAMNEVIPSAIGRSVVVEGIASIKEKPILHDEEKDNILLYTGALAAHSSVNELVDAFCLTTNPTYKLVICGDGVWKDYIKEKEQIDKRIVYKGLVSRKEALDLQKQAKALINPRKPNISVTKYSFPSKTMEYLSSGTPMIGYKLEGIPDEYYQYYYTVDDLSIEGLTHVIDKVLSKPQGELNQKAMEAYTFIVENKTAEKQARRILNFIRE